MKQFDVCASKGGSGKTQTALNTAIYLATIKKEPTLFIDWDYTNCSGSMQLVDMKKDPKMMRGYQPLPHAEYEELYDEVSDKYPDWDGTSNSADIFGSERPVIPYRTKFDNLFVLPAHSSVLREVNETHRSVIDKKIYKPFKAWRNSESIKSQFKNLVIDHAPFLPISSEVGLNFSNGLIIPAQPTPEDSTAIPPMLQIWQEINQERTVDDPLRLLGILINNNDTRKGIQQDFIEQVKNNAVTSKYLVPVVISNSKYVLEKSYERLSQKEGSIFDYPDSNEIKKQYLQVCEFFYKRMHENV